MDIFNKGKYVKLNVILIKFIKKKFVKINVMLDTIQMDRSAFLVKFQIAKIVLLIIKFVSIAMIIMFFKERFVKSNVILVIK